MWFVLYSTLRIHAYMSFNFKKLLFPIYTIICLLKWLNSMLLVFILRYSLFVEIKFEMNESFSNW